MATNANIDLAKLASEGRISVVLTSSDEPGEGLHKQAIQLGVRSFSFDKEVKLAKKAAFMRWGIQKNRESGGSFKTSHGTWQELKAAREAELVEEATKKDPDGSFDPFA